MRNNEDRRKFLRQSILATAGLFSLKSDILSFVKSENHFGLERFALSSNALFQDDRTVVSQTIDNTKLIFAINLEMDKTIVKEGFDLTVFADVVTIKDQITLPGNNIFIFAREIHCDSDVSINTTGGKVADFSPGDKPSPVKGPGSSGSPGNPGKSGGNVNIFAETIFGDLKIDTSGGNGGRGQDGGDALQRENRGIDDRPGAAPCPNPGDRNGRVKGRTGFTGYTGWSAGQGGRGGKGGDAGIISINYFNRNGFSKFIANGGAGAESGNPGNPGEGGEGGFGGSGTRNYVRGRDPQEIVCTSDGAENGDRGRQGDRGATPAKLGKGDPGKPFDKEMEHLIDNNGMGARAAFTQLSMLLRRAGLEYLSDKYSECAVKLKWIERLTRNKPGNLNPDKGTVGSPYTTKNRTSDEDWQNLRNRTLVLLSQLGLGLDFYGLPKNYVPMVNFNFYKTQNDTLLSLAKDIESYYNKYKEDFSDQNKAIEDLKISVQKLEESLVVIRNEESNLLQLQMSLNDEIVALDSKVYVLQDRAKAAGDNLQAAINDANKLSLFEALIRVGKIGASLFVMYQNAAAGISILTSTLGGARDTELQAVLEKTKDDTPLWIKRLEVVKSEGGPYLDKILSTYDQLKNLVDTKQAKLIVFKEDIDREIAQLDGANLPQPQAEEFREALRAVLETSTALAKKYLDLNGVMLERRKVAAQIQQTVNGIKQLNNAISDRYDANVVEMFELMSSLYDQNMQRLLKSIYSERRAFEYYSLKQIPFDLSEHLNVAILTYLKSQIRDSETNILNDRRRPTQLIPNNKIILSRDPVSDAQATNIVLKRQFDDFKSSNPNSFGKLTFSIKPEFRLPLLPDNAYAVTAKTIGVQIPGIVTNNKIVKIVLTHWGDSSFKDSRGQLVEFTHELRPTDVVYTLDSSGNLPKFESLGGSDSEYIFLSPYATWTLEIDTKDGLDLSKVKEIDLFIDLYYLPRVQITPRLSVGSVSPADGDDWARDVARR